MKTQRIVSLLIAIVMLFSLAFAEASYPVVEEPVTFKVMAKVASSYPDQNLGNVSAMKAYEEMTGVHIEWDNVDADMFNNTLAAAIASGDTLPDIILKGGIGNANLAEWGEQGILVDLAPYLEEYAPNFYKLMQEEDTIAGAITTENGQIFGLPQVILAPEMRTPTKFWMNKKAMDKIGMEDPTTLDELYDVLVAIHESDWNENGEADEVTIVASVDNMYNYFLGSFGLRTRGAHHDVVDVDPVTGELRVFATSEDYREFLNYLTKLYSEGLIYPEIFTEGDKQASVFASSEKLTTLFNTVAPSAPADLLPDWYTINWSLEGPKGYAFHTQTRSAVHSTGNFAITESCDPEKIGLALQWVDYFYTEEGSQLVLVGVKDKDWDVKEDGSLNWSDAALSLKTENMSDSAFRSLFGLWPSGNIPCCFYSNLFGAEYGELPAACAQALLANYAPEKIWPNINYTAAEGAVINTVSNDIKSYTKSFAASVITGEVELTDEAWEGFVSKIEDMNADGLIEAYRAALTRVYGENAEF